MTTDVLIVGGGVIGLSIARDLAAASLRVTVLDRQPLGREASWAGAGILPPALPGHPDDPLARWTRETHRLWPDLSASLRETTGIDNGFQRCGGWQVPIEITTSPEHTFRPVEHDTLEEQLSAWRRAGVQAELVAGGELRRNEPALSQRVTSALWMADVCQVRNPWHLRALLLDCQRRSVEIHPDTPVRELIFAGDRASGVRTPDAVWSAGTVVVASGAWSTQLLPPAARPIEIEPVRGQMLLLRQRAPSFRRIIECGSRYLVPRGDGRVLVGSTEERAGFVKETTPDALGDLRRFACELVPALEQAAVEQAWAGLRPRALSGSPWIGPVPGHRGLYLAAGHFRSGLHLSPITARLLRAAILEEAAIR